MEVKLFFFVSLYFLHDFIENNKNKKFKTSFKIESLTLHIVIEYSIGLKLY